MVCEVTGVRAKSQAVLEKARMLWDIWAHRAGIKLQFDFDGRRDDPDLLPWVMTQRYFDHFRREDWVLAEIMDSRGIGAVLDADSARKAGEHCVER